MHRIDTKQLGVPSGPSIERGRRVFCWLALAFAAGLLLLAIHGAVVQTRGSIARRVSGCYETIMASLDAVHTAANAYARLRVDSQRRSTTTQQAEQIRLDAGIDEAHRRLIFDLRRVAAQARSVRASQAALSAADAATTWYEATRQPYAAGERPAPGDAVADLDRLAAVTDAQFRLLDTFTVEAGVDLRRSVEAAVVEDVEHLVAGFAAVLLASIGCAVWWYLPRRRRVVAIAAASVEMPAGRGPEDGRLEPDQRLGAQGPRPASETGARGGDERDPDTDARGQGDARGPAAQLQTALDTMSQGLCLYDPDQRLIVVNRRFEEIYRLRPGALRPGMTRIEVLAASLSAGNHPGRTLADLFDEAEGVLRSGEQGEHLQEIDGGRVVQVRVRPTTAGGFVVTYEDVTERWHGEARIAYMARHDALTDLPNRLLLAERIEGAITQASRENGFAIHCLDLDNFKRVNDTLGHAVGDELLRAVAHRLMACLRESDTVARLGGDEFTIIQADVAQAESAVILARHVVEVVSAPYTLTNHCVTVGVSIGIALAPAHGMAADQLLKNGDVALYRAKGDGRGTFRLFEPAMDVHLQARRLLELDLRAALAAGDFDLHYQPVYALGQNRICGFEALLRWTHPTRGPVSPAEFIPLAEEIGLIVPLGDWVLQRACAEAATWPADMKIAVNVSPAQFTSAGLIGTVRETLERTGLAPGRLELEITETVLMADRGATVAILHALRTIGARIAMDDFGTGYSSLSYLRSFPFDKMKIDQSFIRDLTAENGSGFIVRAVISLGGNLGMTMTAEGVETESQLARLREEGCDEIQGYLISPPVPAERVRALLDRWNGGEATARAA